MAKVKAPLMSFDARGQIAKSLVYLGWKGLKTVRQYVIPANPKSAGQQTQRGYFAAAVEDWHTEGFSAVDVTAWNLLALASKIALSGFNMLVKLKVACAVATDGWVPLVNCLITSIANDGALITITGTTGQTVKLFWGVSKTAMVNEEAMADGDPDYSVTLSACSASTKIYLYIIDTTASNQARTGIYEFTTLT